ncbi:hypothetical protein JCM19992_27430 [Thermostilla marina]
MTRHLALLRSIPVAMVTVSLLAIGNASPSQAITYTFPIPGVKTDAGYLPAGSCRADSPMACPVTALAFSPDGKLLASGGRNEVLLWNMTDGTLNRRVTLGDPSGQAHTLLFTPDGNTLVVGGGKPGRSGFVVTIDPASGDVAPLAEAGDVVYCLAVSGNGAMLAAGGASGTLDVWTLVDRKRVKTLEFADTWVLSAAFTRDAKLLAVGTSNYRMEAYETDSWKTHVTYNMNAPVRALLFSPDGLALYGTEADDAQGSYFRAVMPNPKATTPFRPFVRRTLIAPGTITDIAWCSGKNRTYFALSSGQVRVGDVGSARYIAVYPGTKWLYSAAATADGRLAAFGAHDGTIKIWNAATNKPLATCVQLGIGSDRWITVTASGFATGSSADALRYTSSNASVPAEKLAQHWFQADKVKAVFSPTAKPTPSNPAPKASPSPKKSNS